MPQQPASRTPAESVQSILATRFREMPERVAVEHGELSLTYAELLRAAGVVASRIAAAGARGTDVVVGISMERTLDMPATVLGVLLSGCAYVALPRTLPRQRLEAMLEDSRASLILTDDPELWAGDPRALAIRPTAAAAPDDSAEWPAAIHPESLVYVTFTSGSTGRPKAIAMPQRALVSLLGWHLAS